MTQLAQIQEPKESPYRKQGIFALGEAILAQAVDDYIEALRYNDVFHIINLEAFFMSEWGQELSFSQGDIIIRNCKKIASQRENIPI